ncbi:MAG: hypothetical protein HOC77_11590 [Chloroflexi bacterium]|mgnify:FL=1|jgi:copper chaperone NosL|nr:hypothetical protein [Chloroflexota bacterium]MBT4515720.1 hypothetical protein [Chloroflexota bacterium]MBT5318393.1 hypothetical protein [Chloroflexota bacterium]MBT6680829.1 hypothetical protein [Chloroflexota bacterium]
MARLATAVVALLLLGAVACSSTVDFDAPPEIAYGEEICHECGMIISEARFAAAYVTSDGEVRKFDDAGDMIQHHINRYEDVKVFWLHDFDTAEWIRSEDAILLAAEEVLTPMGHGIVAFTNVASARAFAGLLEESHEDEIRSWDGMVTAFEYGEVHLAHDDDGRHAIEINQ